MTCPECQDEIGMPKFGRFTCLNCKSDLRITADGVKVVIRPPRLHIESPNPWGKGKQDELILVCGLCQLPKIGMRDLAYIARNGGRYAVKSPVCDACLSNTESVTLWDGNVVPRMKPIPRSGFLSSVNKTPIPIEDDGVEAATNPQPREYWSGFERYCPTRR